MQDHFIDIKLIVPLYVIPNNLFSAVHTISVYGSADTKRENIVDNFLTLLQRFTSVPVFIK
ncbi:hypothetical protein GCM10023189_34800 [Nibrella saemangeumensis]|uniref:Uncharacterized protein n=1 Tax=Nibrella saemangeumensis TaxID=1084526 RepID=A0ABP8N5C6_9BACT